MSAAARCVARTARCRGAAGSARGTAGQAAVELIALLPVIGVAVLAIAHVLAAHAAQEAAGHAAHAAAVAVLQDRDAEAAARAALVGWPRRDVRVAREAARVVVEVRPRVVMTGLLERFTGVAVAGVEAPDGGRGRELRGGDGASAAYVEEGR